MQSFYEFFYVTTETTPSEIEPSVKLKEEQRYNKRSGKIPFTKNQESLLQLSDTLVQGEIFFKEGASKKCFDQYLKVAEDFEKL